MAFTSGSSVRVVGDPVLRALCEPVTSFDEDLKELVDEMAYVMYASSGIGLAAPQIGLTKRIFVVDVKDGTALRVFVNPVIESMSDERVMSEEGCLSIPGRTVTIERSSTVTVRACDAMGVPFEHTAIGLESIAIQHENDHLNGVLMIDRARGDAA